ncbi:SH3 domain-containing protein [Brevibacillus humidisoli]|uniref:SH3 domain-containing protein n=1 Tax=Brevibacillus humidisoli TaxID=2895522 RepID=UPI001E3E8099|nr:SH3 domain-containing protein [Brevibacillus humidisoli]UFJ38994.1 SH3 domain-containing protein [Brevibacillus humidisoli]
MFSRLLHLAAGFALLLSLVLPASVWAVSAANVQVTVDKLNVRSGPGLDHAVISSVTADMKLPVLAEQESWTQVQLPDGSKGWVASWLVKPLADGTASHIESTVTNLNVRSGPSQTFAVIGQINPGSTYPVVKKNEQWVQIELSDGKTGWVAGWLVKEAAASSTPGNVINEPTVPTNPSPPPTSRAQQSPGAPVITPPGSGPNPPATSMPSAVSITLGTLTNVHNNHDVAAPVIGQLSPGDTIEAMPRGNGWYQITYDGAVGWIRPGSEADPVTGNGSSGSTTDPVSPPAAPAVEQPAVQPTVTVDVSDLILRSQPTTESQRLTLLAKGTSLTVLSTEGDWYQVKTPDGQVGWVAGWLVSKPVQSETEQTQPTVTIMNPGTNIRSGPGTDNTILTRVQAGDVYPIVKTEGDWFQIKLSDGTLGYVAGWIVSASGLPDVIKQNQLKGKVIVVDPGHGGEDNGATGSSFSTLEKVVNLQVSKLLKNKLEAAGATVILTRSDDRKLSLQNRVDIAVENKADLFVSIHHNTHPSSLTNGTIIFYYDKGNSSKLASLVQSEVVKATNYKNLNARYGNYYVLRENTVVSILAEIAFLSNYQDELRVRSSKHQELAAEGIYRGIVRYFQ